MLSNLEKAGKGKRSEAWKPSASDQENGQGQMFVDWPGKECCCYEMMTRQKRVDRPAGNVFGLNTPQELNKCSPSAKFGKGRL